MKRCKSVLLLSIFCLLGWETLISQTSNCYNLGFEHGNFINWTGYTWRHKTDVTPQINTTPVAGIVSRRHTIISDTSAYDKYTGYALREVPKGCLFSARIGDEILESEKNSLRNWNQSLRYTMTIDSNNVLLVFKFALVLEYASDHLEVEEPRFRLTLYDAKGNMLPDCSNYDVFASNKNIKGFNYFVPSFDTTHPVVWRDWTSVGANLMQYMGQTITIEFMSADCTKGHHFGYAYFVAECHPLFLTTKYCKSDTIAILKAPYGFETYKWTDSNGNLIDSAEYHVVTVPDEKQSFACQMTSATGCVVSLNTSIQRYIPRAEFSSFMLDCFTNTVQLTNQSTTNHGNLAYEWNFGDGTSALKSPSYTFSTSGLHTVSLIVKNNPSECADTLTKIVESFSPPLVGISGDSTYCPGLGTYIKAYGAADYTWSNGSKADSIEVSSPGGKYWLIGHSTTGCVSDTNYINITEEPYWEFSQNSDTIICGKGTATLTASGALLYQWNTGSTDDSITIDTPGIYSVTGTNKRGCQKSLGFKVSAYPLPETDFSFLPEVLDSKHNTLTLKSPFQTGATYTWYFGDGTSDSGAEINHMFYISNSILDYKITLLSTSEHTCTDTSFKYIDVVPYIPNVFTPNGDEINDKFMPGFTLEIVDRNGMLIYKGNDGWDGRYNGRQADPDTYFYDLIYTDSKNRIHTRKGYLVLMR